MANHPQLKISEIKRIALTVVLKKFFELDRILSKMKDGPEGKREAVEKEYELLTVVIEKTLSVFVEHIRERAESGVVIMPTVITEELWDKAFAGYLKEALKLDEEAKRIMSGKRFKRLIGNFID